MLIIGIIWYLIGSIGTLCVMKFILKDDITIGDFIIILTVGGMLGIATLLITLAYWDKKLF